MATQTTYYNLTKPGLGDPVDIEVLNDDLDIIDEKIKEAADAIPNVATQTRAGIVKPDNATVTVDADGTIHSAAYDILPARSSISLSTTWEGSGPYTQVVTISGAAVNANSKIDIQPDSTALAQLISDGVTALWIQNDNGTLTAYAMGAAPTVALTLQCVITMTVSALQSIAITTQPTTSTYTVGDTLDLTGLVVTATFTDQSTKNVTADCEFSPANGDTLSTAGTQTVNVSYEANGITKTASFTVTVSAE